MKEEEKRKKKVVQIFLQCFDGRRSVAQELKLVYSTRATSRYHNGRIRCFTLQEVGVSSTRVPFYLRAVNGRVGQIRPQD